MPQPSEAELVWGAFSQMCSLSPTPRPEHYSTPAPGDEGTILLTGVDVLLNHLYFMPSIPGVTEGYPDSFTPAQLGKDTPFEKDLGT